MVLTTTDVLKAIPGQEALELLRIVACTNSYSDTGDTLKSKTKFSRKQYYSRMSGLMKTGLIKRRKGRHTLTAFGKVVYDTQIRIENAVNNYLNLKAIDSLEDSNDLPAEERKKLIDNLIDSQEIKAILASDINNNNKIESVEPLLGIEQQKARKQTHEDNKKSKDEKHQREQ